MKFKLYIILLLSSIGFAQTLETKVDTNKNKVGAQFTLTLRVKSKAKTNVVFPKDKTFGTLEVIESYPIDTVKEESKFELIKKYGLTQFDTGKFVIPKMPVLINNKSYYSDSIKVEVFNVKVDTLKQKMYDIKPIIEAERPVGDWWKYLLGGLVLAGLVYLGYYLWKKNQNQKILEPVYSTPIEKATGLLQQLEKKQLLEKGEIKAYYSEMTDIARDYIEEAIEIPAKESTTSELIVGLRQAAQKRKLKLSKETVESLEKVLKQADLVKFAQSKPLDYEIEADRKKIESSIINIHKSIPVVVDETSVKWLKEQEEIRKKQERMQRIKSIAGVAGFAVLAVLIFVIITKGIDFVQNGFTGPSTKELVKANWIKSEYGNPAIILETPEVLTRTNVSKATPKDAVALIKDSQLFAYGSLLQKFYIAVSSTEFKQKTNVDLNQALNGMIQTLQSQGCENVIVKQDDFATKEGLKGVKGYGTLSMKGETMVYQTLLFSQEGGLQQIMIAFKEGDENGQKIAERMLQSVELKKAP
ncbi:BatD family protein [Flavobacterium sp. H122]|uniref:BatD family protein n=1 Tax=Flavobacterium sp. H122 TaxID=2529860 RepID=UPI0010A9F2B8|nr:BatD family protein [Flavobacterium sp. H122]